MDQTQYQVRVIDKLCKECNRKPRLTPNVVRCRSCEYLYQRRRAVKRKYNLDLETYNKLVHSTCAICGIKAELCKKGVLNLDHCHKTKKVREPLCPTCNLMLGSGKDNPALLRMGADYLEKHSLCE